MKLFDDSFTKEALRDSTRAAQARQHASNVASAIRNATYAGADFIKIKDIRPDEMRELEELGITVEWTCGTYWISWAN
ncbi:hypothetical protein [Lacticaseibacillus jixiensis]|uniref:hypothetical protein n=1 Tax=Lacticaseibacillus jixiensis TaxID=3231926 RepID=UPI0036F37DA2